MNELIKLDSGKEVITSLEISEITGKQHAHVMRDIRVLLDQGVTESNFGLSEYKDVTGRTLPCYNLTKKGCLILASGYDALLREKIINRWEELETKARAALPATYKDALLALVAKIEEQEHTQALLEAKTEELDESKDWYTIKRRAMILGISWKLYNWRALKRLSILADKPIKKVFDANYGEVNLYHLSIFETYEKTLNLN